MSDYIDNVFGPDGLFASCFANYEMREGQVALAHTIDNAIRNDRHCLCEGPCGVGKVLAYAVPAIYYATTDSKRVVVATANIALQEQLIHKDLPTLAKILPSRFSFALIKGRNNYVCKDRLATASVRGFPDVGDVGKEDYKQWVRLVAWAKASAKGDVSELDFVPSPRLWSSLSALGDECKGSECKFAETCFYETARELAFKADIVVTNYHLLFAHLSVGRRMGQSGVLPAYNALVLDEAHAAADIARDFFGFSVSELSLKRLAKQAEQIGQHDLAKRVRSETEAFFARIPRSDRPKRRIKSEGLVSAAGLLPLLRTLHSFASQKSDAPQIDRETRALARVVARLSETTADRISEVASLSDPNKVYWVESNGSGRPKLCGKPIQVGDVLASELFKKTPSVSLVSATMTSGGNFDYIRHEVGAPDDAIELIVPSPFDFERQALLVLPEDLPDPRDPGFADAVARVFLQVIDLCQGRTLGLFTSYRNLNAVHERLRGIPYRLLRQGDLPRSELVRIFREDVASVLLGTESLWTGIDVAGQALTGLVIDKLPFPPPDDPVIETICEHDPQAFRNHLLPRAIIALRQGIGRLIRSQSDVGVAVLLDRRLADRAYGHRVLASLPPMLTTRRIDNIGRFLGESQNACAC